MASEKLKRALEEQGSDAKMDMSPMIDMVFLLLIFFMVASTLIVNRLDPNVKPSTADSAKVVENAAGRIVINVYSDESLELRRKEDPSFPADVYFTNEDLEPLEDEDAITEHVDTERKRIEESGVEATPKILLRGDHRAVVKRSKIVAKAAGAAGVETIIFASYQVAPGAD